MAATNVKRTASRSVKTAKVSRKTSAQSRLNVRLASSVKERILKAAALNGQDLTEFTVAALSEKANAVIEEHDNLLLSSEEHSFFLDALSDETVSEPSERSLKSAEKYRQGTRKGVKYVLAD